MITQYDCKSNVAGAPGCLQYFTGSTGTITSFNYATTNRHLSDQNYDICVRRESGKCSICYTPSASTAAFGLSISPSATIAQSSVASECQADYLVIPGGNTKAIAALTTVAAVASNRFCGRELSTATATAQASIVSVCSATRPFKISFVTDGGEVLDGTGTDPMTDETATAPLGTVGFSLNFAQEDC